MGTMKKFDIFISYKRKSLATANNLYYRLTTRGYATFFDLEEMRRDNFNVQLLNYIENAKDVFVILEEGSLDACKLDNWEDDWFCKEIAHALKTKRNIIPILIGDYKMPKQDFFPEELRELSLKNALEFSFSYFDEYLTKLVEKGYITAEAEIKNQATAIFKFYSGKSCLVYKEGKLVCSLDGTSDKPYYLPVSRKGDYIFKCIKTSNNQDSKTIKVHIDTNEEKVIMLSWQNSTRFTIISTVIALLIILASTRLFHNKQTIINIPAEFYLTRYSEVSPIFTDDLLSSFKYDDSFDDSLRYNAYPIMSDTIDYYHYPIFTIMLSNTLNKTIVLNEAFLEIVSCEYIEFEEVATNTKNLTEDIPSIKVPIVNIEFKDNSSYPLDFFDCTLVRGESDNSFRFAICCDKSGLFEARLKFVSTEESVIYTPLIKILYYQPNNVILYPEYYSENFATSNKKY